MKRTVTQILTGKYYIFHIELLQKNNCKTLRNQFYNLFSLLVVMFLSQCESWVKVE